MPVHLVTHPLAQDALASLRDIKTQSARFRRLAERLSLLLAAEALKDLPTETITVATPMGDAEARRVTGDVVVVPVLRAGLGMLDAVLRLIPWARVGHIGLRRDEATAIASRYYTRLPPNLASSYVLMVDPMLATGGSAVDAIQVLTDAGAHDIRILCIVAAPEGIRAVEAAHPNTRIYTPVIDRGLNDRKFIVPGLGDFGDRLYGTE